MHIKIRRKEINHYKKLMRYVFAKDFAEHYDLTLKIAHVP